MHLNAPNLTLLGALSGAVGTGSAADALARLALTAIDNVVDHVLCTLCLNLQPLCTCIYTIDNVVTCLVCTQLLGVRPCQARGSGASTYFFLFFFFLTLLVTESRISPH